MNNTIAPPGPVAGMVAEAVQPIALQVAGKIRRGVLLEDGDQKQFIFADDDGNLSCYRLKFGENSVRATAEIFSIPRSVVRALYGE